MDDSPVKREGMKRGIYLLPNLCTTANLFCGFYSIIASLKGEFVTAAWAILLAGIFDFMDGRVARLAKAHSEFGIEYDSLVDLASFGLAPGVLVYTWALQEFDRIGWLAAFLFFACGALRLARFNVQIDNVEKKYFQGLPIPVAAYVLATLVIFHDYIYGIPPLKSWAALFVTVVLALLMVSTLRYYSFKQVDFRGRWSFFMLVIIVGLFFLIAAEPKVTMLFVVLAYVATGIVEEIITRRKSKAAWNKFQNWRTLKELKVEDGEDDRDIDISRDDNFGE
ncbi:MAG: CDP-diacylglycerol--serine O-phosphatidyltransferase [Deltaproteobacteria bacterium]|nr:CDP-diacylglycerol--serine O-phosphatidyltransferase [Deltaproteobacteria bacterium]MBI2342148.1 CDP-diacylglycerol--serine O-phosphatidyltransferase [Deltaproteobacteria bacterium]MBI2974574.1 CDP-diacylglycerol--serine O-phosphatidyltransferase [Deltaproteobacteria bacterium]